MPEDWPDIPPHAVEIDGLWALPERLTEVDGRPYVRCYLHGLIPADHRCSDSPHDHYCMVSAHPNQPEGEPHDDQGTSHREWADAQADKLSAIRHLHQPTTGNAGGLTSGLCSECSYEWPCPTVHIANGWGEIDDCWNQEWCRHAGVKLLDPTDDFIEALRLDTDENFDPEAT